MFLVIESTPGYLPEEDEPAQFEDLDDARVYASDRLSMLLDFIYEGQEALGLEDGWTVSGSFAQGDLSVLVYDKSREHDLGRVIEIVRDDA